MGQWDKYTNVIGWVYEAYTCVSLEGAMSYLYILSIYPKLININPVVNDYIITLLLDCQKKHHLHLTYISSFIDLQRKPRSTVKPHWKDSRFYWIIQDQPQNLPCSSLMELLIYLLGNALVTFSSIYGLPILTLQW